MNCGNGCDYRKICNYNEGDSCNNLPISWKCDVKGNRCNVVNSPPNKDQNLYSSLKECQVNCRGDIVDKSWRCSRKQLSSTYVNICIPQKTPPNPSDNSYPSLKECESKCI